MQITVSDAADADLHILLADRAEGDLTEAALADARKTPLVHHANGRRTALIALDPKQKDETARLRTAALRAGELALKLRAESVAMALPENADPAVAAEGFGLAAYAFTEHKTDAPSAPARLTLVHSGADRDAVARAEAVVASVHLARDLVNRSPDRKSAPRLARAMAEAGREAGLRVDVWGRQRLEAEGMGGILAVARGSVEPPRFVVVEHAPEGTEDDAPVVLVGKAVVFDTGGLSLKPTASSMDRMKSDMAGGAVVFATMTALARLGTPRRVIALIPMTDNRPGGDAYVPGDVVTMRGGTTVEVLNTDAEGRMLLADALAFAQTLRPEAVVDVATLTGAAVIALGSRVAALCAPQGTAHAAALLAASERTGEPIHPMPMHAHYAEMLESDTADLKNIGGREAGTITAAKFLEHFTRDGDEPAYPWAHLDIAGPSFPESSHPHHPKGATGFGVRLLIDWLTEG